jgi:hypothetical protein
MDDNLQKKQDDTEAQRRLEQYRKLRKDMAQDNKDENENKYQRRVTEMEKKEKSKPTVNMEDGDDFLKGMKTFGTDD